MAWVETNSHEIFLYTVFLSTLGGKSIDLNVQLQRPAFLIMPNPNISNKAFWDISFNELDFEKSSLFVMTKVFNYGTWNDQVAIMKYYSLPRIRLEIVHSSYLRKPVLSFLCTILQLQKTDFKCYNKMQLNPLPWNY